MQPARHWHGGVLRAIAIARRDSKPTTSLRGPATAPLIWVNMAPGGPAGTQGRRATRSISTSAPTASPVTPTVVRAGSLPGGKAACQTAFIAA